MKPGAKKRYMVITLKGGRDITLNQREVEAVYNRFGLTPPDINRPILGLQFIQAINTYGMIFTNVDDDDLGIQTYIPPHEIERVIFVIADYHLKSGDIKKREKRI